MDDSNTLVFSHPEFKTLQDYTQVKHFHTASEQSIYIYEGAKHISQLTKHRAIS